MPDAALRLRPRYSLFTRALAASIAFMVPVSVVLYVIALPVEAWRAIFAVQVGGAAIVIYTCVSYLRVGIWIGSDSLRERGFFGRVTETRFSAIRSALIAETDGSDATTPVQQLFVCGENGTPLLRMRGQYWSRVSMAKVVGSLDVPVIHTDGVSSMAELDDAHPRLLYWWERNPMLAGLVYTAAGAAVAVVVLIVIALTR